MILVDTSVWIDHLHKPDRSLERLLRVEMVVVHPFVIGEVALGSSPQVLQLLRYLDRLPRVRLASDEEVLRLIDDWQLRGTGIGYLDAHLLASVLLTSGTQLWTRDRNMRKAAQQLSLAAELP